MMIDSASSFINSLHAALIFFLSCSSIGFSDLDFVNTDALPGKALLLMSGLLIALGENTTQLCKC
jgi:hypothetical protein